MNYFAGFVAVMILIYLVNSRRDANMKMTWIILILAVPVFGVVLFIYTRIQPGTSVRAERLAQLVEEQRAYLAPGRETIEEELAYHRHEYGIFKYIYEGGNYPSYRDPAIKYFPLGEDKFEEMLVRIETNEPPLDREKLENEALHVSFDDLTFTSYYSTKMGKQVFQGHATGLKILKK